MPHFSIDPDKSIACCQKQLADLAIEKRMLQAHTENTLAALAKRQHDNEAILAEDQKKSREFRDKRSLLQEHQEKLTMAQAEYSRAEARYQQALLQLDTNYRAKNSALQNRLETMRYNYSLALKAAAEAANEKDIAAQAHAMAQENACRINAEQEEICHSLKEELSDAKDKLTEALSEALADCSRTEMELAATQKSADLIREVLENTAKPLKECDDELLALNQRMLALKEEQDLQLNTELKQREEEINKVRRILERARRDHDNLHSHLESSRSISQAAAASYEQTKVQAAALNNRLRNLFNDSQNISNQVSAAMAEALRRAGQRRETYQQSSRFLNQLTQKTNEIFLEESVFLQELDEEAAAERELQNAATVARNLAEDAANSRTAANPQMQELLAQMESSLQKSADKAQQAYEEKAALVQQLRNSCHIRKEYNAAYRETLAAVSAANDQARIACQETDKAVLALSADSAQRESQRQDLLNRIRSTREEYENTTSLLREMKDNMEQTARVYRQAELAEEDARIKLNATAKELDDLSWQKDQFLCQQEESNALACTELATMLSIAGQKKNQLKRIEAQKQQELSQALGILQLKKDAAAAAQDNYRKIKAEADSTLEVMTKRINSLIFTSKDIIKKANDQEEETAVEYDKALQNSLHLADKVPPIRKLMEQTQSELEPLHEEMLKEKQTTDTDNRQIIAKAKSSIEKLSDKCSRLASEIPALESDAKQAHDLAEHNKHAIAWLSEHKSFLESQQSRIARQEQEINEKLKDYRRQAEENAQQEQERRRRQQELAVQQELLKAEELREKARQDMEQAHLLSIRERDRLEAAVSDAAKGREQSLVRLAAGEKLSCRENLALLETKDIEDILTTLKDIVEQKAAKEDLRWISKEEAAAVAADAEKFSELAKEQKILFNSARANYNDYSRQLTEANAACKKASREYAAVQAQIAALESKNATLNAAAKEMAESDQLQQAMAAVKGAVEENCQQLKELKQDSDARLTCMQQKICARNAMEKTLSDTMDMLGAAVSKWLYSESLAYENRYKATAIQKESADRAIIEEKAQKMIEAAREQAAQAAPSAKRLGSIAPPGKKQVKKKFF